MPRFTGVFAALMATVAILIAPLERTRATHSPHQVPPVAHSRAAAGRSLPLLFETASDSDAAFVARSRGYAIRVTARGAALRLPADVVSRTVELAFADTRAARVVPEGSAVTHVNYLVGAPDKWRTGVPAYERVRLADVYPGIDAIFYGNGGDLEYDLVISPGAPLDCVRMRYSGADAVETDGDTLRLKIGASTLEQRRVTAYQDINGHRVPVDARYVVSRNEVRFAVGAYDHTRTLVLDPTIAYSTYFGESSGDIATAIATDGASRLVVVGWADGGDFPVPAITPHTTGRQEDAYVAKFNTDGSVAWLTFFGGAMLDMAYTVAIGPADDIYVGGITDSADFPTTAGAFHQPSTTAGADGFVVDLSEDGRTILHATCLGGIDSQTFSSAGIKAIRLDGQDRIVIAGDTASPAFPVTIASSRNASPSGSSNHDAFVARLSSDLSQLQYSRLLAGAKWDSARSLAVDRYNDVYVTGTTTSSDFPVLNALEPTKFGTGAQDGSSGRDGFLAWVDQDGNLVFSTYLGGAGEDDMYSVVQGLYDRVYVGGDTTSTSLSGFSSKPSTGWSGIIFEIVPNGTSMVGARYIPDAGNSYIRALTVGRDWDVWAAGMSDGQGWPWVDGNGNDTFVQSSFGGGNTDVSIQKWSPQLDGISYSALFGGRLDDLSTSIVSDPLIGDIYFAGQTSSDNFPVVNAVQPAPVNPNPEGIVAKLACTITEVQAVPVQPATGGSDATRSTADSWCFIAGTSDAPWLHVTGTSGAQVTFSTDPNTTTSQRTGHITITGRTVVAITQAAGNGSSSGGTVDEIVLNATDAHDVEGRWQEVPDSLHGTIVSEPDQGDPKLSAPLADPANYFEFTFNADANKPYHLWIHGLAQNDSYLNDSAWVQFSDSVDGSGNPVWRIGTTDGTFVSLEPCAGCGEQGWGWRDNQYGGGLGPNVVFTTSGMHTMRIQQREDGFSIGQVTLSAVKYLTSAPGADRNDTTVLQKPSGTTASTDEVVLYAASSPFVAGNWITVSDTTAAGGARLWEPDQGASKITVPSSAPANYFEITFNADAGKPYHLWLRMKAENDSYTNDSVWVQFSGSVDASGNSVYRIGTTSGAWVSLEECSGCGEQGWGWQDNAYGSPGDLGPAIYFAQSGPQTLRIQQREDGVSIDQIVLSAVSYATTPPGSARNDATILPRTQ